jgi:hypothetical protein
LKHSATSLAGVLPEEMHSSAVDRETEFAPVDEKVAGKFKILTPSARGIRHDSVSVSSIVEEVE